MSKISSIPSTVAGKLAILAGATAASAGVVQVLHPHEGPTSDVGDWAGYLTLSLFAVFLVAIVPTFFALARYANSRRAEQAAKAAAAGTILLALAVVSSIVHGEDYGFFAMIAPLANAGWLFGSIAIAIWLRRAGRVSAPVYVGLPLSWIAMLPMSVIGGGVLTGAYYLTVGYLLANDAIERADAPLGQPAHG